MGHITVTGRTMSEAERRLKPLLDFDIDNPSPTVTSMVPQPTRAGDPNEPSHLRHQAPAPVAVIMGSDSDLKTLVPGLQLLKDHFSVIPEVEITSAHRTPLYMTQYCQAAARRGIKVIIAAAGGAAHLPGMAAANTSLPVIGVPVKGSTLDGVDSLHSIVQMPRGVPVATVGIGNSVNAALLAMRIIGTQDENVAGLLQQYANNARDENLDTKGAKLRELGWEAYWEKMQQK
ncbi:phosphoribosylaminoimidazole carboxylase ade2 [Ascosphaera aggregata]|nr:phosphoribosylaminoimidazole carboxylase ade2 [Ascosphaera aggregata]